AGFDVDRQKVLQTELKAAKKSKKVVVDVATTTAKVQGALVALDPHPGEIRALVGGREFKESQFNRAFQAQRQPGSAFKPFVWTAAMDDGMTEATGVDDARAGFYNDGSDWKLLDRAPDAYSISLATAPFPPDQAWAPQKWDFKYFGAITLRTGIALSRNLVSIRLTNHFSPKTVVEYAHRCGIRSPLHA